MLPIENTPTNTTQTQEYVAQFNLSARAKAYYGSNETLKKSLICQILSMRHTEIPKYQLPEELIAHIFEQSVPTDFVPNWKALFKGLSSSEDPDLENKLQARCAQLGINYKKETGALAEVKAHFLEKQEYAAYFEKQFGKTDAQQLYGIINHLNMLPTQAKADESLKGSMHTQFVAAWDSVGNIEAYRVPYMTELSFENQQLFYVPDNLKNFKGLKFLSFFNNNLKTIPVEIGALTNLRMLYIHKNRLSIFPNPLTQRSKKCAITIDPSLQVPDGCKHLEITRSNGLQIFNRV